MADIQIGVNQGDTVYYYDESIGNIVSRDWLFPGGSPTGGTAYGPAIQYNNTNSLGYDASLFVTDYVGATGIVSKKNIIVVYPETITAQITATPSVTNMGTSVSYQSTGSTGSGYASYVWSIPGLGSTSGASLANVTNYYSDWNTLTGSYTGLPGASYIGTATLAVTSNVGNNANATQNVTFYKYGPQEEINYNTTTPISYPITGPYYTCSVLSTNSGSIGLGGSNVVLKIDQDGSYSGAAWDNLFFHSTNEYCYHYPNNDDLSDHSGYTFGLNVFKTIFSGASLTLAGATYNSNPPVDIGNYIRSGYISANMANTFYITDYPQGGDITNARDHDRRWSNNAITEYMSNKYYLTSSSKFIENGGFGSGQVPLVKLASVEYNGVAAGGYHFDGGYGATSHGPCVPSSRLFLSLYGSPSITIDITITITAEDSTVYSLNCGISTPGGIGNTPDLFLISAHDTNYGSKDGLVRRLNSYLGLVGSPNRLSKFVGFEEAKWFAAYEGGGAENNLAKQYDSSNFPGIRMYVSNPEVTGTGTSLDGKIIKSIGISWGPNWGHDVNGHSYFPRDRELCSRTGGPGETARWNSWLGLNYNCSLPFITPTKSTYLRGWRIGGGV